jgi:hypothetical protein
MPIGTSGMRVALSLRREEDIDAKGHEIRTRFAIRDAVRDDPSTMAKDASGPAEARKKRKHSAASICCLL